MTDDSIFVLWRTLKEIHAYYLAHVFSEDGRSAEEVIRAAETHGFGLNFITTSENIELLEEEPLEDVKAEADRLRHLVTRTFMKEAADGVWFALGRRDGADRHEIIHPTEWSHLFPDIEGGSLGRESRFFRDLLCAFTHELSADDPIRTFLRSPQQPQNTDVQDPPQTRQPAGERSSQPEQEQRIVRTGAPGRPSSMYLIVPEFKRRVEAGEVSFTSVADAARSLRSWFLSTHTTFPPPSALTIENNIRDAYREAKAARKKPTKL